MYCIWTTFSGSGRIIKKHIQHILRTGLVTQVVKHNYVKSYMLVDKKVCLDNVSVIGFCCDSVDKKLLDILQDLSFKKLYIATDHVS